MIYKIIKTVSGETLIAEIMSETISYVEVKNPFKISAMVNHEQQMRIEVIRWDWSSRFDQPFRIYKTAIVAVSDPTFNLLNSYTDVVNSESYTKDNNKFDMEEDLNLNDKEIH